ncbi:MAG: hypothetical protein HRT83_05785 [Hyphomicrobiaceae bacterium]|nr:hypothetical protein [Hyphomicrobiaceae bacterium]
MIQILMSPGSCSTGVNILLEELYSLFEVHILKLPKEEHLRDKFKATNPTCTVPVPILEVGGEFTDFMSIA